MEIFKLFNLTYLCRILSGLILILSLAASPSSGEENMNPAAESILHSMSSYLATTKALSVNADVDFEIVTPNGQKLQLSSFVTALIERPANLHLTRKGTSSDYELFFNDKLFTVYSRTLNAYSQIEGSGTIDEAFLAHEYTTGLPISGGDFFFSDPFTRFISGVESVDYIGIAYVYGVKCHHLAFRNEETDWQLWVKVGDQPLPMKYVITTKWVTGAPQYEIRLRDWETNPEIEAGEFLFSVPENAKKLDVIPREKFPGIISRGGG